jgi:hypothetical protein
MTQGVDLQTAYELMREANDILMARNERLRNEFARLNPQHVKRSDESRMAFDRWLERLK